MMQLHAMVSALTAACLLSGRGSSVAAFTAAANGCFDDNPGLQEAIGEAGATCAYALKQNYCVTNTALSKKYCPVRTPQLRPHMHARDGADGCHMGWQRVCL